MASKKERYEFKTVRRMKDVKKLMKKGWEKAESSGRENFFWGSDYQALMRRPNPKFRSTSTAPNFSGHQAILPERPPEVSGQAPPMRPPSEPPPAVGPEPGSSWWSRRSRRTRFTLVGVGALVVLAAFGSVFSPPDDEPAPALVDSAETITTPAPTESTSEAEPGPTTNETEPDAATETVFVDLLVGTRYSDVADVIGDGRVKIDYYDLGPNLVDGVDRQRAVFDTANWYVLGQCPEPGDVPAGSTVTVGVVKYGEIDGPKLDALRGDSDDLNYWGQLIPRDD